MAIENHDHIWGEFFPKTRTQIILEDLDRIICVATHVCKGEDCDALAVIGIQGIYIIDFEEVLGAEGTTLPTLPSGSTMIEK